MAKRSEVLGRGIAGLAGIALAAGLLPGGAVAQEHDRGRWHDDRRGEWRGDIHRFHEHDFGHWREGRWWRGWHDGREGWWWMVGGAWYWYPAPVYPYPDPYRPPLVAAAPPGQYWYYCPNPPGYYPYVPACPVPWQMVPAGMPAPPQAVPMQPVPQYVPQAAPQPMPQSSPGIDKATGGTVLGAIGGGVAGAQFGHGSGKLAATAFGTLLGAFIGHEVGTSLDRADVLASQQAERTAYQAPLGQAIAWNSPQTGHSGSITPVRDGTDSAGHVCREFQQTVVVAGKTESAFGTACRQPDGSWKVVGN